MRDTKKRSACVNGFFSLIFQIDVTPAGGTYIPHDRFLIITCSLVFGALICGVLFPSGVC